MGNASRICTASELSQPLLYCERVAGDHYEVSAQRDTLYDQYVCEDSTIASSILLWRCGVMQRNA